VIKHVVVVSKSLQVLKYEDEAIIEMDVTANKNTEPEIQANLYISLEEIMFAT